MRTQLTIRPATIEDANGIAHVHVESWRSTYSGIVPEAYLQGLSEVEYAARWREWLVLDVDVFVAEMEGGIVGFIGGGAPREPQPGYDAELFTIYMLREWQRQGIGTALLHNLAKSLVTRGFQNMVVWVLESNASGEFYRRLGAAPASSKEMEIGGALLPVGSYGWPDLRVLASKATEVGTPAG